MDKADIEGRIEWLEHVLQSNWRSIRELKEDSFNVEKELLALQIQLEN